MIKINFLKRARAAGVEVVADDQILRRQAGMKVFMMFLPVIGLYVFEAQRIPSLKSENARKTTNLTELKAYNVKREAAVKEIKKIKEDEGRIQQRIFTLEKLQKDRTVGVKVLKLLSDAIPEKAWLTKVEIKGEVVKMVGYALTGNEVSSMAEKLKSNILVAQLQLNDIREERMDQTNLMKFDFTCFLEEKK